MTLIYSVPRPNVLRGLAFCAIVGLMAILAGCGSTSSGKQAPSGSSNSYATGPEPYGIAVGDFNGDGKLDVAVTSMYSNNVTILLGKGDGTFTAAAASPATGKTPVGIVAGDFNGDGKLDLAVADEDSNSITILLGNGDGTFKQGATIATGGAPWGIAAGDFNGDG